MSEEVFATCLHVSDADLAAHGPQRSVLPAYSLSTNWYASWPGSPSFSPFAGLWRIARASPSGHLFALQQKFLLIHVLNTYHIY